MDHVGIQRYLSRERMERWIDRELNDRDTERENKKWYISFSKKKEE